MKLIHNAKLNGTELGWVTIEGELIGSVGVGDAPARLLSEAEEVIDAQGMMLLPGAIDVHVHFREPGLTHKADIETESRAAIAGGVTSFIEMPNTVPPTVTIKAWEEKMALAAEKSAANYAFMLGATADNLGEILRADARLMPAVKVFMGSSTGNMLLDDDNALRNVFSEQPFRVVVHAEDQGVISRLSEKYRDCDDIAVHSQIRPAEACVRATERAMELASRYGTRLHVAHVSTAAEARLFDPGTDRQITAEASPHHLIFTNKDYARAGARIKMNPAVKSESDRAELRRAVADGRIAVIATDHAPHLLEEKAGGVWKAVSGAPMVQFSLVSMLDMFGPEIAVERMSHGPAEVFGIHGRGRIEPGYYADLVMVEKLAEPHIVADSEVLSKCGWTPLAGRAVGHAVRRVWVNGGEKAQNLEFE